MSERIQALKAKLAESRAYLNRVLDAVGSSWDNAVFSDGAAWDVRQLLIHLADADLGSNRQVMGIVEGAEIIPENFDLERYNRRAVEKRAEMTVEEARASLEESRAALNIWLDALDDSALDRRGRHASMRILSVGTILEIMADHERTHADDIAAALGINI